MLDDIDYQILTRRMLDFEDKLKQLEADVDAFGKELDELSVRYCVDTFDTDNHVLSEGSFSDAGLPQSWRVAKDTDDVEE